MATAMVCVMSMCVESIQEDFTRSISPSQSSITPP
jgi:hypothetical protein